MVEEILFHGTTEQYHQEMVRRYGVYQHEGNLPIYLTEHAKLAR